MKFPATLTIAIAAAACTPPPAPEAPLPPGVSCGANLVGRWLGALPTEEVKEAIDNAIGDRPLRIYSEGDPITMDYSPRRLNVELGANGRIKHFRCG